MKKLLKGIIFANIFAITVFLFLLIAPNLSKPTSAACPPPPYPFTLTNQGVSGYTITIGIYPVLDRDATLIVRKADPLGGPPIDQLPFQLLHAGDATAQFSTDSSNAGNFGAVLSAWACPISTQLWFTLDGTSGGIGTGDIGVIVPPGTLPTTGGDPTGFVAGLIKGALSLLILIAFIVDLIWTIIAGLRFVTAGGDPKSVSQAWSQIYWGLIGMVVVMGSFAIIILVEKFFKVSIISGGITLPTL